MQAELDYFCALFGHDIVWVTDNTAEREPPPGEYIRLRCGRVVEVKTEEGK